MAAFADFVRRLLTDGSAVLRERPRIGEGERPQVLDLLAEAFADYRLDVAGPLVPFDAETALLAVERLAWACWFLVQHGEPEAVVEECLVVPDPPPTAGGHLSADLVWRFLPQVHRRARAADPSDVLTRGLAALLRHWPLTGVLADLEDGPQMPVELGGHPGLLLLYAERLAEHPRPAWVLQGPALPYVEMVFAERGLRLPVLPPLAPAERA